MRVFGIRNEAQENPIFGDYVVDSVCLLNKRFNPQGRYFYFDEGNVTQQIIGGHKVFDKYGWVVTRSMSPSSSHSGSRMPTGRARRMDRRR